MQHSRYPFTEKNKQGKLGVDVDVKAGGLQIEFEDQDPRIHAMYLAALEKNGVPPEDPVGLGTNFRVLIATGDHADCGMTGPFAPGKTHIPACASANVLQPGIQ